MLPDNASLTDILRDDIRAKGPIPVAAFMARAVSAYYARGTGFGAAGDFTTAPEISQVFGELVGLWAAVVWRQMGAPAPVRLIELGPGRGTLMADFLRAVTVVPDFAAAIDLHLVETSPALRILQRRALGERVVAWHDRMAEVPDGPALVVANEFFDALPIRQLVRAGDEWRERVVKWAGDGFVFALGDKVPDPPLAPAVHTSSQGAIAELCPEGLALAAALGRRLVSHGGAALIIDYGPARSAAGDSLQAIRRHAYHPPLERPGEADLTAHVDFQALAEAARTEGAQAHGPVEQGDWLRQLGLGTRVRRLLAAAPPQKGTGILRAAHRLVDPAEMGTLFKVLALTAPSLSPVPGFEA
ncbi:MAG: SAM-dependent methyltransferase [Alphaproteobacteria bacterium]|nr:SAM-dependent methyltransferase [Alphaproteobacteria bacterium]